MKHLKAINNKAGRVEWHLQQQTAANDDADVVALQDAPQQPEPHIPLGCSLVFFPGWETDSKGGTAGLCSPVERDLFDCHLGCFGRRTSRTN